MGKGPLDDPRLRAIEERLNRALFDEAQRLLSALSAQESLRPGAYYLATRLLYQRGRLDDEAVKQRLREVVAEASDFPEAQAMLSAAEAGRLRPDPVRFRTATLPPEPTTTLVDPREPESWTGPAAPPIPRAPPMPTVREEFDSELSLEIPRVPDLSVDLEASFQPGEADLAYRQTAPAVIQPHSQPGRPARRDTLQELVSHSASWEPPQVLGEPEAPASSVKPPSSGSAWRKKNDTIPASPRRSIRSGPVGFDLEPKAESESSIELAPSVPLAPDLTRVEPPSSAPKQGIERPGAIRSFRPSAPEEEAAPTGFSVAALLDDGEPGRALALLDRWGGPLTPELVLLKARALAGTGRRSAALFELDRVAMAPLVEPELRASTARLLIELCALDQALAQARRAHEDDPNSVMVRLTLAWALVRAARRSKNRDHYKQAESLLSTLRPRATPLPALVHALRACVTAVLGDPEKAISTAQLAVGLDPRAADALAALAQASLRLGRRGDAERAWVRLQELDRMEATALAPTLEAAGIDVDDLSPSSRNMEAARAASIWDPLEVDLAEGRKDAALAAIQRLCEKEARGEGPRTPPHDFSALARDAAGFFTTAPVFRHFAPYDLSLASTSRLEAALSVLYGAGPRMYPGTSRHPLVLYIGSYLGECVRQAFGGRWRGSPMTPALAAVEARGHEYSPFERVEQRLKLGRSIRLDTEVSAHPAAEPHAQRAPNERTPPAPWDPREWPEPSMMPLIGRGLSGSVVALYTAELAGGPLDGSVASVATLDNYVALLAPATAPPEGGAGWVRRAAAITGAYLIEVLCENMDAVYVPNEAAAGPLAYEVVLPDGTATHPVLQAYDRLAGKRMTPLSDYVARLARKR